MTGFEIAFNVIMPIITIGCVLYMRHILQTCGRDRIDDPELVRRFRETAPYHLLPPSFTEPRKRP